MPDKEPQEKIYLTEQSVKELLEGKTVYNNDTEIIPPKTNKLGLQYSYKPLKCGCGGELKRIPCVTHSGEGSQMEPPFFFIGQCVECGKLQGIEMSLT